MFLKDGIESVDLDLSLLIKLVLHVSSVNKFLVSVGELSSPGVFNWDINVKKTLEFGDVGVSAGDGVFLEVGVVLALSGGNLESGIGILLLLLESLADTLDGLDDIVDILGFKLKLDGLDECLTEIVH